MSREVYKDTLLAFIHKSFDVARSLRQFQRIIAACMDVMLFVKYCENYRSASWCN